MSNRTRRDRGSAIRDRLSARVRRTIGAIRLVGSRGDALAVAGLVAVAYLLAYFWAIDRLSVRSDVGFSYLLVDRPLERALDRTGPFSFEPIALVDAGVVRVLVSPVDVAIGGLLAVLVGLNLAVAFLAIVRPAACGLDAKGDASAGAGVLAAVPALLSGTACCAPTIVLALGIGASGTLLTVLPWLLPVGIVLLLVGLTIAAKNVAPPS